VARSRFATIDLHSIFAALTVGSRAVGKRQALAETSIHSKNVCDANARAAPCEGPVGLRHYDSAWYAPLVIWLLQWAYRPPRFHDLKYKTPAQDRHPTDDGVHTRLVVLRVH
jgi:hypothetical protein